MKASEARALTNNSFISGQNAYLKTIYEKIKEVATGGKEVAITVKSPSNEAITKLVMEQLVKDGYVVRRSNGYDQRDMEGWDNLTISW